MEKIIKSLATLAVLSLAVCFIKSLFEVEFLSPDWCVLAFGVFSFCALLGVIINEIWSN